MYVCNKAFPAGRAEQIELDVRRIEGRNAKTIRFKKRRHRAKSMRAGKVSHDRNQPVLGLELFEPLKLLFRGDVVLEFSGPAGFEEHLCECRILSRVISSDA